MKIKKHIANLFDRMCKDAVICGLREEIKDLTAHNEAQQSYIERLQRERKVSIETFEKNRKYIEALLCNFESKGSMTFEEFTQWHNNFTGGWYSFLIQPKRIRLTVVSFCFHDMYEITKHPRSWFKCKPELQAGTELRVRSITRNFYGTFYCCDIPEGVELEKGFIPTYDIPLGNAEVIEWGEPENVTVIKKESKS